MVKHLIDKLIGKTKKVAKVLTFIGVTGVVSALGTGCDPYSTTPPEKPTPTEQTEAPTATPTAEPTPTPESDYIISGKVESDTGIGDLAEIEIYDPSDPYVIQKDFNSAVPLKKISTDNEGNFSITLDSTIEKSLEGVILQAKFTNNGGSYIKTLEVPQGNQSITISLTPFYSDFDNDGYADLDRNKDGEISQQEKEDYVEHIGRENYYSDQEKYLAGISGRVNSNPNHGLKKWNRGEVSDEISHPIFKGFKIDTTAFSEQAQTEIENGIWTSSCPGASEIVIVREANPIKSPGWVPIYHSEQGEGPYGKLYDVVGGDGYLEYAEIYLNTSAQSVVGHEAIFHVYQGCSGHSNGSETPELFDSIGAYTGGPDNFTGIDIKTAYHINANSGMSSLKDNLGL